jgi:hypothetical protein
MKVLRNIFGASNIGGIENNQLYTQTHFGTKQLIDDVSSIKQQSSISPFVMSNVNANDDVVG